MEVKIHSDVRVQIIKQEDHTFQAHGANLWQQHEISTRVIDVPVQDNALQENVDIGKGATIDAMIEDIGTLVHESHSSEELDIDIKKKMPTMISMKIPFEDADNDPNDDSIDENDEDSDK
ncbi:hypothetical protein M9H77_27167 [Catharanthus roseus]|uniref:Uncharacterized protein n=1 Tax=Catharanthus roseus TaxID=4058 RepID=A0ACC0AC57_CATRO|nr:hypothetical protein M9H77_27167 [Catharanthus roseus]